jgi:hypothetical protein
MIRSEIVEDIGGAFILTTSRSCDFTISRFYRRRHDGIVINPSAEQEAFCADVDEAETLIELYSSHVFVVHNEPKRLVRRAPCFVESSPHERRSIALTDDILP